MNFPQTCNHRRNEKRSKVQYRSPSALQLSQPIVRRTGLFSFSENLNAQSTHEGTDYTKLNLQNLKRAANRDLRQRKKTVRNGRHGRCIEQL